jgi:hypothetical protein
MKEKKGTKQINIAIPAEIEKKLNEGNYNKNKLINELLKKFLEKTEK